MRLTSPAFRDQGAIPRRHTAASVNELPPLRIADVPGGAQSLAIVVEDVDSPLGEHVTHWVVWNLPPDTDHLDAVTVPMGCCVGTDSFGKTGYTGPMALEGRHHFRFRLFALDTTLDLPAGATRAQLDEAIRGHVVATAELTGYIELSAEGDDSAH